MDARDAGPDSGDEILDVFGGGFAAHQVEHSGMDVLEGHVDVAGDLFALGDALDEFVAPMSRMGVEEADPEVALDLVEFRQEPGEGRAFGRIDPGFWTGLFVPEIHAKVGGVLADQVDFTDAF